MSVAEDIRTPACRRYNARMRDDHLTSIASWRAGAGDDVPEFVVGVGAAT
jgi:hypothetical protein